MLGGRVQWRDVPELSLAVAVGLSFFCLGNAALHDAGTDDTPPPEVCYAPDMQGGCM
jgi:hypothetical protein